MDFPGVQGRWIRGVNDRECDVNIEMFLKKRGQILANVVKRWALGVGSENRLTKNAPTTNMEDARDPSR